jgi:hypothetical protein
MVKIIIFNRKNHRNKNYIHNNFIHHFALLHAFVHIHNNPNVSVIKPIQNTKKPPTSELF